MRIGLKAPTVVVAFWKRSVTPDLGGSFSADSNLPVERRGGTHLLCLLGRNSYQQGTLKEAQGGHTGPAESCLGHAPDIPTGHGACPLLSGHRKRAP